MSDVTEKKGVGLLVEHQNAQNEKAEIRIDCEAVSETEKLPKRLKAYAEKMRCV